VSNALRHANASEIELCWRREGGNSILLIRDNGTGLNNEQTDQPKGLGLAVMRTRAQSIGASFHIRSRVGNGTEVRVMLNAKNGIQNGEQ
jgi:signal transduction histidine kinase